MGFADSLHVLKIASKLTADIELVGLENPIGNSHDRLQIYWCRMGLISFIFIVLLDN